MLDEPSPEDTNSLKLPEVMTQDTNQSWPCLSQQKLKYKNTHVKVIYTYHHLKRNLFQKGWFYVYINLDPSRSSKFPIDSKGDHFFWRPFWDSTSTSWSFGWVLYNPGCSFDFWPWRVSTTWGEIGCARWDPCDRCKWPNINGFHWLGLFHQNRWSYFTLCIIGFWPIL